MSTDNGSHVTWRELNLALDPIKGDLREMKADLSELRADVHAFKVLAESRSFLGARGRAMVNGLMVAVPSAVIAAAVSLLAH